MFRPLLAVALVSGCSDYGLNRGNSGPDGKQHDPEEQDPPTETAVDSAPLAETGDTVVPAEGVPEGRIDVVLIEDVAYFYDCYHADLAGETDALIDALFDSGADVAMSIASYDDYQVDGEWFASTNGLPYVLEEQITTDESLLHTAAAGLSLEWGGDGPGSGLEALVQVAQGHGYDQDCDAGWDAKTDIRPFATSSSDPFGGTVAGADDSATPGTGSIGGVGFRKDSKRVIVLIAENTLRDATEGHEVPTGTCPGIGTRDDAEHRMLDIGTKFLGVNAYEFQDIDPVLQQQLEDLADTTSSHIDRDLDGAQDDQAVLYGSWDWPPTEQLVQAIWDLVD